jgi:hypothetical protein
MPPQRSCTRPSRGGAEDVCMDILAIFLGLLMFAVLYLLIEGIDRV